MKRLFIIAIAAAAGSLAAGCEKNGGGGSVQETTYLLTSSEEVTAGVTTRTEYEWTDEGAPKSEICKVDGKMAYQDSGYEYDTENAVITCYRTYYDENGQSARQEKRVTQYYSPHWVQRTGLEVYDAEDPGNTTPLESMKETYSGNQLTRYEEQVNGTTTLLYYDYAYDDPMKTSYSVTDSRSGTTVEKRTVVTYTDNSKMARDNTVVTLASSGEEISYTKYEYTFAGVYYYNAGYKAYNTVYMNEKPERILAEEQTNYSSKDNITKYDTILYEDDGVTQKSKTSTTLAYKTITITIDL